MKSFSLNILCILVLFGLATCDKNNIDSIPIKEDFFLATKLLTDSVNLTFQMGSKVTINSTKGDFVVSFSATDPCPKNTCATCYFGEGRVKIVAQHQTDSVNVPEIYLPRCGKTPIFYPTPACLSPKNYFYSYSTYGNLIFCVKELSPYPETINESNDFYYNKKYKLNLTLLNICN